MLADCHTHLDQYPFTELQAIVNRAELAGVRIILLAGTTISSSKQCVEIANYHPNLLAGIGIHPLDVTKLISNEDYSTLRDLAISSYRVVSISEIGLDFSTEHSDLAIQFQVFREQIRLAREVDLPIIFHSREIPGQPELQRVALRILREERGWEVGGAMHYFQGDVATALECIDLGFYISMAKPLLRELSIQEVAKQIPLGKIVLETDSYPQPFKRDRSRWTEPKDVATVADKLAELHGIDRAEVESITFGNTINLLTGNRTSNHRTKLQQILNHLTHS